MASIYNIDNWSAPVGDQKFKKNAVVKDSMVYFGTPHRNITHLLHPPLGPNSGTDTLI